MKELAQRIYSLIKVSLDKIEKKLYIIRDCGFSTPKVETIVLKFNNYFVEYITLRKSDFPPSGFGSLNQPSSIINNSLFGGGFGGGTTAIGGGLFGGIQPHWCYPQNQFNNSYAFGAQNLFNVQNQVADNYNNFNENQYNDYGGLYLELNKHEITK